MQVNYTTYDIRRGQDTLNPRTHADIMIPASDLDPSTLCSDSGHPFRYARILGVFHANVLQTMPGQSRAREATMEFLLVRWFRLDTRYKAGFNARRLYRLQFIPETDENAFGFLNPDDIIRAAHIIPAFAHGRTNEYLGPSSIREEDEVDEDWRYLYVNM